VRLKKTSFMVLFLWFSLDIIGVPKLVEAAGVFSLDMLSEIMLAVILIGYLYHWRFTDYLAILFYSIWGFLQYWFHWRYLIFGATSMEIKGYNKAFGSMYHIMPTSDIKIVPDAYHIILHILLVLNLIFTIQGIMKRSAKLNQ